MNKRSFALTASLCCLGYCGLNAQIPRPKPYYPQAAQQQLPAKSALPAQPVVQDNSPQAPATLMAESMDQLDDKRKLVVGDQLSFRVVQDREPDARRLFVTEMGEVEFPLIGRVKAVNKTLRQLAGEVKQLMDREYYFNSTVLIGLDSSSKFRGRIYIIGQVAGVGPQDIPADEVLTVSKAILRAGGFSDFANQRRVKLVRKGMETEGAKPGVEKDEIIIDCKAIFQGDTNAVDPVVQPDDMIVVPQRLINF